MHDRMGFGFGLPILGRREVRNVSVRGRRG